MHEVEEEEDGKECTVYIRVHIFLRFYISMNFPC